MLVRAQIKNHHETPACKHKQLCCILADVVWRRDVFLLLFFMSLATVDSDCVDVFPSMELKNVYVDWKMSQEPPSTSGWVVHGREFNFGWTIPLMPMLSYLLFMYFYDHQCQHLSGKEASFKLHQCYHLKKYNKMFFFCVCNEDVKVVLDLIKKKQIFFNVRTGPTTLC